ncbi:MAG: HNH endonuclease [Anaerolineae bacterium]|nr:HNH endonuclease [Anaerolineae bacterium]
MNDNQRPQIPEKIKRSVRQRCGFGCVVCGLPIYDYDHIYGFNEEIGHIADEITLLCPQHHREKTVGLLTTEQVLKKNNDPINRRRGFSSPYRLNFEGHKPEVMLGTCKCYPPEGSLSSHFIIPIVINDVPVIMFKFVENQLLFDLQLRNAVDEPLLLIRDNVVQYASHQWDIKFVGQRLTIREKLTPISLSILFKMPNRVVIERAEFYVNGINFRVTKDSLQFPARRIMFSYIEIEGNVMYTIGEYTLPFQAAFNIELPEQ